MRREQQWWRVQESPAGSEVGGLGFWGVGMKQRPALWIVIDLTLGCQAGLVYSVQLPIIGGSAVGRGEDPQQ